MARTPIPKSVRFEVFKRDKFTCQYCGKSAPEVVLEIDHIKPVSKGGKNDILNLITACRACNRGKTNRELSDGTAVMKQKRQLEEIQDRREQLELLIKWRDELNGQIEAEIDAIDNFFKTNLQNGRHLNTKGRQIIKRHILRFGFNEVYSAAEYAFARYGEDIDLQGLYGICFNHMKAREANARQND